MTAAIWNTITITLARQAIALPIAILLAWDIARTDIPAATSLEFLFGLGYFLPPLPVTMGWILLLDPQYGLINQWLTLLPFIKESPFNIYSFWGIVWAHLTTSTIAVEVMLFTPAFRNMDATLEEASLVSGAGVFHTLRRIVVPIMTPIGGVFAGHRSFSAGIRARVDSGISISVLCVQHANPLVVEPTAAAVFLGYRAEQHDLIRDGAAHYLTA
jgi:iron(III) transport system permease protein